MTWYSFEKETQVSQNRDVKEIQHIKHGTPSSKFNSYTRGGNIACVAQKSIVL